MKKQTLTKKTTKNKQQIKKTKTHSKNGKQRLNRRLKNKNMEDHDPTENSTEDSIQDSNLHVFRFFSPCSADFPSCSFKITILQPSFPFSIFSFRFFACFFAKTIKQKNPDSTEVSTEDSIPDSYLHVFLVFPMFSRFPKFFLQNQMLQPSFRCFFFRYTTQQ